MKKYLLAACVAAGFAGDALALVLNPNDFSALSLGALPSGSFTLDTSAGGGGFIVGQGGGAPDIAVFAYDGGSVLGAGDTITVTGSNALALLFLGSAVISGTIDVSGGSGGVRAGGVGVAGGGNGGRGNVDTNVNGGNSLPGVGPGGGAGGRNAFRAGTGAGGGFGTAGGQGGAGTTAVPGGTPYGDPSLDPLLPGSGGGGGGSQNFSNIGAGGGAGGGALEIGALTFLDFMGATILSNGGDGGDGFRDGGAGSGGGLLVHAFDVTIDAGSLIQANGGVGGAGADMGGCGGAGRIEILHNTAGGADIQGTVEGLGGGTACLNGAPVITALANIGEAPVSGPIVGVPEPASLALFATGLIGLIGLGALNGRKWTRR